MIAWIALALVLLVMIRNYNRQKKIEYMWTMLVIHHTSMMAQWKELEVLAGRSLSRKNLLDLPDPR